jgi:hypothetical protein
MNTNARRATSEMPVQFASAIIHLFRAAHLAPEEGAQLLSFVNRLDEHCQYRFAEGLTEIGFDERNAQLVAKQIVPKPILYALLIRLQIPSIAGKILSACEQAKATDTLDKYLDTIYAALLPEIFVYLLDQTIDGYNAPELDGAGITYEVKLARNSLISTPSFYFQRLWDAYRAYETDKQLKGYELYKVLRPLFDLLNTQNSSKVEIHTLFQAMSDVITGQHLVDIVWSDNVHPETPYHELIALVAGNSDPLFAVDPEVDMRSQLYVRYTISNVGLTLVTASTFLFEDIHAIESAERSSLLFVETLVQNPMLVRFTRITEALIRLADDISDLKVDIDAGAANLFRLTEDHPLSATVDARDTFVRKLCHDFELDGRYATLRSLLSADVQPKAVIKHIIKIWQAEGAALQNFYGGDMPPMLAKTLAIYNAIATGAIEVNGKLSDKDVENF